MHLSVSLVQNLFYIFQVVNLVSSAALFKRTKQTTTGPINPNKTEIVYKNDGSTESAKYEFIDIKPTYRVYVNAWGDANVALHQESDKNPQLSKIESMESTWKWNLKPDSSSGELVSNVAYDFFTSDDQKCEGAGTTGCTKNEFMIWMHKSGGMGPIGEKQSKTFKLGNCEFDAYSGKVSVWNAYSLVAKDPNGCKPTDKFDVFKGISWIIQTFSIPKEQYLITAGAGAEIISGKGTLETTEYSMEIKPKTSGT
ncbi:hypothetical protein CROQUDRAFT_651236 [Cronartium quercuum f. sp. fusiforme G11]|uniref:Uncharacterized protein n=1 Tax=Cronartium quercuum f. sp. fusiforme G11 TaxID=708437 RepID=A0A9P6TI35_9BASI|nr:hypothetical protein CROQUDRAFT_651236 [Cronartium quercuum f. sp. fusiforme G11]